MLHTLRIRPLLLPNIHLVYQQKEAYGWKEMDCAMFLLCNYGDLCMCTSGMVETKLLDILMHTNYKAHLYCMYVIVLKLTWFNY